MGSLSSWGWNNKFQLDRGLYFWEESYS